MAKCIYVYQAWIGMVNADVHSVATRINTMSTSDGKAIHTFKNIIKALGYFRQ